MNNLTSIVIIQLLILITSSFSSLAQTQKTDFMQTIGKMQYKQLSNYKYDFSTKIASRVKEIPDFLLKTYQSADNAPQYKSYSLTDKDMILFQQYVSILPPLNKSVLEKRLIAFYVIDGFKGSAVADYVLDDKDTSCYYYIILNSKMFTTSISDWLTYRENSIFIKNDSTMSIQVDCGIKYQALLYALLHESSHVVDYTYHFTPYTEEDLADVPKLHDTTNSTPFIKGVWNSYWTLNQSIDFPNRDKITVFGFGDGPKINITDAKAMYDKLIHTPIVSLYACKYWAEDFAEFVMAYHLSQKLGQPYRIKYFEKDTCISIIEPMKEKIVLDRVKLIDNIYRTRIKPNG